MTRLLSMFLLAATFLLGLAGQGHAQGLFDKMTSADPALWGDRNLGADDRIEGWKKQVQVLRDSRKKRTEYRLEPDVDLVNYMGEVWRVSVEQRSIGWARKKPTVALYFIYEALTAEDVREVRDSKGRQFVATSESRPNYRGNYFVQVTVSMPWEHFLTLDDVDGRYTLQTLHTKESTRYREFKVPGEALYAVLQVAQGTWWNQLTGW